MRKRERDGKKAKDRKRERNVESDIDKFLSLFMFAHFSLMSLNLTSRLFNFT